MLRKHPVVYLLVAGATLLLLTGVYRGWQLIPIGSAYTAKILCSSTFISQRPATAIRSLDLGVDDLAILKAYDAQIDRDSQRVTASLWGLAKRTAVYQAGRGCYLQLPLAPALSLAPAGPQTPSTRQRLTPLPSALQHPAIDHTRLQTAITEAFSEPQPERPRRTRAVVVLYQGSIIGERYAEGIQADMPLAGWSMTKSMLNALIGIRIRQGRLCLDCPSGLSAWQNAEDPRQAISIHDLLQMQSGLAFDEDYSDPLKDVTQMLLAASDMAGYAAAKALTHAPGSHWSYSSGNSNILSRLLRETYDSDLAYWRFPQEALFTPLGMHTAVLETDTRGHFVGSSYGYASARDWARLGLLYLNDGVWNGERILPEDWVSYSTTAARQALGKHYGAHFWLKIPPHYQDALGAGEGLPLGSFHAIGHEGQFVSIIPSKHLVVVRLGLSRLAGAWNHEAFLRDIITTIRD